MKNLRALMPTVLDLEPTVDLTPAASSATKKEKAQNGPPRTLARENETESQQGKQGNNDIETQSHQINIARVANLKESHNAVRAVVRTAARLADLCTGEDLETDARVIREACDATFRQYDKTVGDIVERPDHKTRLAATTLRRAYVEGLPVKREERLQVNVDGTDEAKERMFSSPALRDALRARLAKVEPLNTMPDNVQSE